MRARLPRGPILPRPVDQAARQSSGVQLGLEAGAAPHAKMRIVTNLTPRNDALSGIRARLDDVDTRLVGLLVERAELIREVIDFKREQSMGVVDRGREDEMLARIGDIASSGGLDPRIARQVLRAVIDAFTLLEVEQLGPD